MSDPKPGHMLIAERYSDTGHWGRYEKRTTYKLESTRSDQGVNTVVLIVESIKEDTKKETVLDSSHRRFAVSAEALIEFFMANGEAAPNTE